MQTVLIVDDDQLIINSIKRTLRKEQYETFFASDADEALQLLRENDIDVVLSDQIMPKMLGTELLDITKQEFPDTIRIIMSGHSDFDHITTAFNDGIIERFIPKPINNTLLKTTLLECESHNHALIHLRDIITHSEVDMINGLPNKEYLDDFLTLTIAHSKRRHASFSTLLIDIFQEHKASDDKAEIMLTDVFNIIKHYLNKDDFIFRTEDSGFIVITQNIRHKKNLANLCEEISDSIRNSKHLSIQYPSISAITGISVYPDDATTKEKLLECAKDAIANAKNTNQNHSTFKDTPKRPNNNESHNINDAVHLSEFHNILSSNAGMLDVFEKIKRISSPNAPIFIYGQTGTGKELIAKAVHIESSKNKNKFIAFNCSNFNEQLFESQFFGHIKGSFTGAINNQEGILSAANHGTLFLDEITELSLSIQSKLLRVLQEKEYSKLGSTVIETFDTQIISASSTEIRTAVKDNKFRSDLMYRLDILPIYLPRLKERGNDSLLLFKHFIYNIISNKLHDTDIAIDPSVIDWVQSYDWPGNVRELQNITTYIAALSPIDTITMSHLPKYLQQQETHIQQQESHLQQQENSSSKKINLPLKPTVTKEVLISTLEKFSNNKTNSAKHLQVSRMTLYRLLKKYEL